MKKFLVLYHSSFSAREQMAQATPEQAKAGMDAWISWAKKNNDIIIDLGTPVSPEKTIKTGYVSKGESTIAGYSIIQGDSIDSITKKFEDHPHCMIEQNSIEIFECLPMPGM